MITDSDLQRLISGDMTAAERADFAERVCELRDAAQAYVDDPLCGACGIVSAATMDVLHDCPRQSLRRVLSGSPPLHFACPSHGPDTRQRDGHCYACGVKLP
jgi:hypothetical protein